MAKTYFRQLPDFDYVNRTSENRNISAYETVKNIFKRAKISDDIFSDLTFFTKYKIIGDDRPDNVANKFYDDPRLDWIVLLSNNIMNVQTEWPMTQSDYYDFLIDKYGDEATINKVHHHRCTGVTTNDGIVIVPEGLTIESDFSDNPEVGTAGLYKKYTRISFVCYLREKIATCPDNVDPRYLTKSGHGRIK